MPSFMDLDTIDQVVEQLSQMELQQPKIEGKENDPKFLLKKAITKNWRRKRNIKNTLLLIKLREI